MSIRATVRGGNARHPIQAIPLALPRNLGLRGRLIFSFLKVAAPLALTAGLVVVGSTRHVGPSPIAALAEPGGWSGSPASLPSLADRRAHEPLALRKAPGAANESSSSAARDALSIAAAEAAPERTIGTASTALGARESDPTAVP